MSILESPIPLSDIEDVLAWVDTFKLSRGTKKINRDFSDAVLLAEILSVHYPKLVEMHNYPPRNSHSLKLNNWMTLNRKVLKKLRLNLCCNTMEQLANCTPGVIERVLLMVRDKIRRDEEVNKSLKEGEQNMSSGGSYYEACADDEHVLVVPVKTRVNGVLESIQKKVVSHEYYLGLKEELKDAKDTAEMLKQKVEHLDNLIMLKEERIEELQKQLERKQSRRKEFESCQPVTQNSISVPFESEPPTPKTEDLINIPSRSLSLKFVESTHKNTKEESKIPVKSVESIQKNTKEEYKVFLKSVESVPKIAEEETKIPLKFVESIPKTAKEAKIPGAIVDANKPESKPSVNEVASKDPQEGTNNVDRIKSEVFKEVEIIDQRVMEGFHFHDSLEFINESDLITGFDEIDNDLKDINFCYQDNFIN